MELTRSQLNGLHTCMSDLLENAEAQESITAGNIHATNRVIIIFSLLGALLAASTFYLLFSLTNAISHSVKSMETIDDQVKTLRIKMATITSSVESMGRDVESLHSMNASVGHMAQETATINNYIANLNNQTKRLDTTVISVRHHVNNVNLRFSSINQAIGGVSYSLHETAKPIRQFIPMP